jgi:hypothetical protein
VLGTPAVGAGTTGAGEVALVALRLGEGVGEGTGGATLGGAMLRQVMLAGQGG